MPRPILIALAGWQKDLDREVAKATSVKKRTQATVGQSAEVAWRRHRRKKALRAVEHALQAMASGLKRCMYCEDSRGCDVEHFRPKARYPRQTFVWWNLLLICAPCNRAKNDNFDPDIIDPTVDDPLDHMVLSISTGRYTELPSSARGRATLKALPRLNGDQTLVRGRQHAFTKLKALLRDYASFKQQGRLAEAEQVQGAMVEEPFSAAFASLIRQCRAPGARVVLGDEVVDLIAAHPEVSTWLQVADVTRIQKVKPQLMVFVRNPVDLTTQSGALGRSLSLDRSGATLAHLGVRDRVPRSDRSDGWMFA